jgi:mutator protein MutT
MKSYHRLGKDGAKYYGKRGAGIIFTDGQKILLLRRADGDHRNTWGQPGGKVEPGETPIDAAVRESKEECGVVTGSRIAQFEEKDGGHQWTTYIYKIDKPFKCKLSHEHNKWKWFEFEELDNIDLHPKLKENIDLYIKRIKQSEGDHLTFREWVTRKESP